MPATAMESLLCNSGGWYTVYQYVWAGNRVADLIVDSLRQ